MLNHRGNKNRGPVAAAPRQPRKLALRSTRPRAPDQSGGHKDLRRCITGSTVDLRRSHLEHQAAAPVAAPHECPRRERRLIYYHGV